MNKLNTIAQKTKKNLIRATTLAETAMFTFNNAMTAHASGATSGGGGSITVSDTTDMDTIVVKIIGFICDIARYVGIALLAYGLYSLYMAFKDENPDGKIKSVTFCVVALGLITIKTALQGLGIVSFN